MNVGIDISDWYVIIGKKTGKLSWLCPECVGKLWIQRAEAAIQSLARPECEAVESNDEEDTAEYIVFRRPT
jgi:hypothetical protein